MIQKFGLLIFILFGHLFILSIGPQVEGFRELFVTVGMLGGGILYLLPEKKL